MQIDILMAIDPRSIRLATTTLTNLLFDCDVECRLAILAHGATRARFRELDDFIREGEVTDDDGFSKKFVWHIKHVAKKLTFVQQIQTLADMKKNDLAMYTRPGFVMNDDRWFGKMQRPFITDATCMAVFALNLLNSNTPPMKPFKRIAVDSKMIMGGKDLPAILYDCLGGEERLGEDIRTIVSKRGGSRWAVHSIRHILLEDSCPDRSEKATVRYE